jgi:hypothetical protein
MSSQIGIDIFGLIPQSEPMKRRADFAYCWISPSPAALLFGGVDAWIIRDDSRRKRKTLGQRKKASQGCETDLTYQSIYRLDYLPNYLNLLSMYI